MIKRSSYVLSIMLLCLTSCAEMSHTFQGKENEAPAGYQITHKESPKVSYEKYNGKIRLVYKAKPSIVSETEEKIKNEVLNEKDARTLRAMIPKGGKASIWIFRPTVETANLKMFDYIIFKNGKEVSRFTGGSTSLPTDTVPSTPSGYGIDGGYWINIESLDIPVDFKTGDSIGIYVLDKLENARDEFTITVK